MQIVTKFDDFAPSAGPCSGLLHKPTILAKETAPNHSLCVIDL